MPTTRSQGRFEPLQRLETPPKRQRKRNPRKSPLILAAQDPPLRTLLMSLEPKVAPTLALNPVTVYARPPSYVDASTQTEQVMILTMAQAAELRERINESTSHKRSRDDESEDERVAKRHQFSTPQNNKPNTLWMFGGKANSDYPRTAPSKSLASTSFRRSTRGPLTKRSNIFDSPHHRARPTIQKDTFDSLKPIESENKEEVDDAPANKVQDTEESPAAEIQTQQTAPQTPRRGLFGSLRGMVNKGWDLATTYTPLGGRMETAPPAQRLQEAGQVDYPQIQSTAQHDDHSDEAAFDNAYTSSNDTPHRPLRHSPQPTSQYDHLHYIPADSESVDKAMTGEIEPPPLPPAPLSPTSRLKAQNPGLSDATIESIVKKRERKAALDEERYGPRPKYETSKVAPLFGPDSHYARGTVDPRFLPPTPLYGPSKKRKIESLLAGTPKSNSGSYGFDDEELDAEMENVDDDRQQLFEEADAETPRAKRHRIDEPAPSRSGIPATPRSALKKPGMPGSMGRKSVAFGSSMSRDIRGHYGPAGQYKGSTFADEVPDDSRSISSIDHTDIISPTTRINTFANSLQTPSSVLDNFGARIPKIDFTLRDPNDRNWRPSLGNPKPGVFRVPDIDEEDPDESMSDDTPEQPQTPRMSHAELPSAPNTMGSTSFNESSIMHESTELALDKARSKAEKYKPKSSSRLSEVSRARSRSTSPDAEDEEEEQVSAPKITTSGATAPAVRPIGTPPQPFVPRELDNTVKGTDGMTDYEREHQYDAWAASLRWDEPQTYEDAGTGTAFIHNLIRKNWNDEDTRRSELFWAREFDEVERAMDAAEAEGQRLILVTGMEEIEGY